MPRTRAKLPGNKYNTDFSTKLKIFTAVVVVAVCILVSMYKQYLQSKDGPAMSEIYDILYDGKANGVIPVLQYRSKNSGMTVVIAQVEGPLVNGYFCLATEAFDDDGLPHTLEHLVFMGSEDYPYKGVLDLMANRCLASGTNAWTDTDHTAYTMTTAGSEGFLNLLPVFLDHVLYPTLTESAYVTEVHHINGEGDDAGVVYCEMQARENTGESRTHLAMLRAMYPEPCGYRSETGGMLENLRTSTSHEKVKKYHEALYRPENLCLTITGQVSIEQVARALEPFENKFLSKGSRSPYIRPWQGPVPPLDASVDQVVQYGADEEDNGIVLVAWRGPLAKEQYTMKAIMILMEYLTDTAVSPLQRDFVEIEDAYCSSVRYSMIENSESCIYISFQNVPKVKLQDVKPRLVALLERLGERKEEIDMARMSTVVHRQILEAMSHIEDQPHDTLAFMAIGHFLYGDTKEDLDERCSEIISFKKLQDEGQDFWVNLLNKYFVNTKLVTIVGEPSISLMEEMGQTEKERVNQQATDLGETGLKQKAERLQKATEDNEVEPSEVVVTSVPVPNVESISYHPIKACSNHNSSAENNQKFPLADIPVTFQLDDIQTNFATINVLMDTAAISKALRYYLPLFLQVILESPVLRDGKLVSHEDVIKELAADTLENQASLGIGGGSFSCGAFSQVAMLNLKVEQEKYTKAVQWVRELLYQTQFTPERLRIIANKMINTVPQHKRNGRSVVQMINKELLFRNDTNHHLVNMLRQHKFLTALVEKLDDEAQCKKVIEDLNQLRAELTKPCNMRVHLSANVDSLAASGEPQSAWLEQLLPSNADTSGEKPQIHLDSTFLNAAEEGPEHGIIIGVGSVESSFLIQTTPSISSFEDEDLPALMVYIQYLTQLEGPMWRQIRGLGLSYHYSMYVKVETGLLNFILFKSTHVAPAYKQAKEIVDGYLSGSVAFSDVELESAKSSLIFEIIEEVKTPSDASHQSLLSYFRSVTLDYNRQIIQKIPGVSLDDLKRVGVKYITPLFDPAKSKVAICCHPTKVEEVASGFKEMSRELKVIDNMETSLLAEL